MTDNEMFLLRLLQMPVLDGNQAALLLQSYIAEYGPLSEEAGTKVRELLKDKRS
jgi:hypothetical protein